MASGRRSSFCEDVQPAATTSSAALRIQIGVCPTANNLPARAKHRTTLRTRFAKEAEAKGNLQPAEPKTFEPPTNAKKLPANQSAATSGATNAKQPIQQRGQSSAVGKPANANTNGQMIPAYAQSRQQQPAEPNGRTSTARVPTTSGT